MTETPRIKDVRDYWDSHLNMTQFLARADGATVEPGSEQFFAGIEQAFTQYNYKNQLFSELARQVGRDKKLLEIGCGLGIELGRLASLGFDVTGIDLAPNAIQMANRYLELRQLPGSAQTGNAEALEFADATFDVVYSSGVLHHTPNIDAAVAEIWRVLKPGGQILIVLYHRHSWFYLLHRLTNVNVEFDDSDAPIINAYSASELRQMFDRFAGLSVEFEYYRPNRTRRSGFLAGCYNHFFVPTMRAAPKTLVRRFGWHVVVRGVKRS